MRPSSLLSLRIRVRDALARLRHARERTGGERVDVLARQARADSRDFRGEGLAVVVRIDGALRARVDVALVEAGDHVHQADAGDVVAGLDAALDGRGAAPARQEGRVHVDEAARRRIEQAARNGAVGGDDGEIKQSACSRTARRTLRPRACPS